MNTTQTPAIPGSMQTVTLSVRCLAFTGEGVRLNRIEADLADHTVSVWDSVAGHYTTHHALSARSVARILRLASRREVRP